MVFTNTSESTSDSIPPYNISPFSLPPDKESVKVTVNGFANKVPDRVGEMWLHDIHGGGVKLLHGAIYPSYLSMTFIINDLEIVNEEQSSSIESTSMYMLAGGKAGSEYIEIDASLEIYINNTIIYSKGFIRDDSIKPIAFQAMSGDELRFVASRVSSRETDDFDNISALWLFTPSGEGIKLIHNGINK